MLISNGLITEGTKHTICRILSEMAYILNDQSLCSNDVICCLAVNDDVLVMHYTVLYMPYS